jgi:hypothetical protein
MQFDIEVRVRDFSSVLSQFVSIAGWSRWKARLAELDEVYQRSPVTQSYLRERHALEFELSRLRQRRQTTGRLAKRVESTEFYRLASMATATVAVHRQLSATGKNRLRGMLLKALNSDFRAIEHEVHIATHLVSRGFDVRPTDMEGEARFDYLANNGDREVEIECKSVGYDLGRKVHLGDFNALAERLYPICKAYVDQRLESKLIVLSLRQRLNTNDNLFSRVSSYVNEVLERRRDYVEDAELLLECSPYHPRILPPEGDTLRQEIEKLLGTHQFHVFVSGNSVAAVVFVARSQRPDQVLSYMFKQMKGAASQFTRTRPAIVCVQVEGVYPDEWHELATGSSLQVMTDRYLRSKNRSHVHTVVYNSTGWLERRGPVVTEHGTALYFRNKNHPMRDDPLVSIFA